MYYLQSRYYDPAIGRFISADAVPTTDPEGFLSYNMFAYCENNPVSKWDPTGEFAITTIILIGSIIVGTGTALYTGCKMRQAGYDWVDTLFNAAGAGLCAFATIYTLGMSAYELYYNMSLYYGQTPITEVGKTATRAVPANTSPQHLSGTGSPNNNATPNGSYTKVDNQGRVYSYTQFDSQSRQTMRIDFQGKPHAGVLPHIHTYVYLEKGGRAEYVFNTRWELIQ